MVNLQNISECTSIHTIIFLKETRWDYTIEMGEEVQLNTKTTETQIKGGIYNRSICGL